ncbi:MAG: DUF2628 domain-containing protein [Hydrogenothermaceae bacterium]|nr:DUF2628 domain-containing protein [Hydrogenothermaceae bacterium]
MTREERDIYRLFVGKSSDYYIQKWEEIESGGNKISWNWSAFFFGLFWLGYRKMYPHAFGLMIFSLILQYIQKIMNTDPVIVALTNLSISIVLGMFGNYLYYEYTKSKIQEIQTKFEDENMRNLEIVRTGGESLSTAIAIGLMYIIASSMIEYGLEDKNETTGR